jgi:hypothetical protein
VGKWRPCTGLYIAPPHLCCKVGVHKIMLSDFTQESSLNPFVTIVNKGFQVQRHWASGLCTLSGIVDQKTTFGTLELFLSSVERRVISTLLGSLERDNLNHWSSHLW